MLYHVTTQIWSHMWCVSPWIPAVTWPGTCRTTYPLSIWILHRYLAKNYTKELSCSHSHPELCTPHRQEEEQSPGCSCLLQLAGLVIHLQCTIAKLIPLESSLSFCLWLLIRDEVMAGLTSGSFWWRGKGDRGQGKGGKLAKLAQLPHDCLVTTRQSSWNSVRLNFPNTAIMRLWSQPVLHSKTLALSSQRDDSEPAYIVWGQGQYYMVRVATLCCIMHGIMVVSLSSALFLALISVNPFLPSATKNTSWSHTICF